MHMRENFVKTSVHVVIQVKTRRVFKGCPLILFYVKNIFFKGETFFKMKLKTGLKIIIA